MYRLITLAITVMTVLITIILTLAVTFNLLQNITNLVFSFITNFKSPFTANSPSQFVFLTCMVTSTLTLAVIGNRLRDKKDLLRKEEYETSKELDELKKNNPQSSWIGKFIKRLNRNEQHSIYNNIENSKLALTQINIILWVQLAMIYLSSFRIVVNLFEINCNLIDFALVVGTFLLFGILWPCYFFFHGGGKQILE